MLSGLPGQTRPGLANHRVFRSAERLWSCDCCGFVNSSAGPRCSVCDEPTTSPGDAVDAIILEPAPGVDRGGHEADDESVGVVVAEPGILPEVVGNHGALTDPLAQFDQHTPEDSEDEASTSNADKRTWEDSLLKLVGRIAAPASFVLNGATVFSFSRVTFPRLTKLRTFLIVLTPHTNHQY